MICWRWLFEENIRQLFFFCDRKNWAPLLISLHVKLTNSGRPKIIIRWKDLGRAFFISRRLFKWDLFAFLFTIGLITVIISDGCLKNKNISKFLHAKINNKKSMQISITMLTFHIIYSFKENGYFKRCQGIVLPNG